MLPRLIFQSLPPSVQGTGLPLLSRSNSKKLGKYRVLICMLHMVECVEGKKALTKLSNESLLILGSNGLKGLPVICSIVLAIGNNSSQAVTIM